LTLPTSEESSPLSYPNPIIELLLSYDSSNPFNPIQRAKTLLSWAESIVTSEIRKEIVFYLLENPASTTRVLLENINFPESSLHRELKKLVQLEIVEPIVKARYVKSIPGRSPGIYGLKGHWRPDDIANAVEKYRQLKAPNYALIKTVSQSIMEDFLSPRMQTEIKFMEINQFCKETCKGYYSLDISKKVANYLTNKGVAIVY